MKEKRLTTEERQSVKVWEAEKKTWTNLITKVHHSESSPLSYLTQSVCTLFKKVLQYCKRLKSVPYNSWVDLGSWGQNACFESRPCRQELHGGQGGWTVAICALRTPLLLSKDSQLAPLSQVYEFLFTSAPSLAVLSIMMLIPLVCLS